MKIVRFMSNVELKKFLDGETLFNYKDYPGLSNSRGFCFFPEIIKCEHSTLDAGEMIYSLNESEYDVMVTFNLVDNTNFFRTVGRYDIRGRILGITEYCVTSYSKDSLAILAVENL